MNTGLQIAHETDPGLPPASPLSRVGRSEPGPAEQPRGDPGGVCRVHGPAVAPVQIRRPVPAGSLRASSPLRRVRHTRETGTDPCRPSVGTDTGNEVGRAADDCSASGALDVRAAVDPESPARTIAMTTNALASAGCQAPGGEADASVDGQKVAGSATPAVEDENDRVLVSFPLPAAVEAAFDEAMELHRAISGRTERPPGRRMMPTGMPRSAAARTFSIRCRRVPSWVGLLAMLEDFTRTWDDPRTSPRREADAVYIRDGWRCAAPGCTSRQNLEEHHIVYRSRGGGNEMSNRICSCRFHHQLGEHGSLAICSGLAPLGTEWSLGKAGIGGRYRNDRRIEAYVR